MQEAIGLWESLLEGPLEGVLQHTTPFLRACACDCLSAVGSAGFAGLQVGHGRRARRATAHTVALTSASRPQLVFLLPKCRAVLEATSHSGAVARHVSRWRPSRAGSLLSVRLHLVADWFTISFSGVLSHLQGDGPSSAHACLTCPTTALSAQCQALPACGATPCFWPMSLRLLFKRVATPTSPSVCAPAGPWVCARSGGDEEYKTT